MITVSPNRSISGASTNLRSASVDAALQRGRSVPANLTGSPQQHVEVDRPRSAADLHVAIAAEHRSISSTVSMISAAVASAMRTRTAEVEEGPLRPRRSGQFVQRSSTDLAEVAERFPRARANRSMIAASSPTVATEPDHERVCGTSITTSRSRCCATHRCFDLDFDDITDREVATPAGVPVAMTSPDLERHCARCKKRSAAGRRRSDPRSTSLA